MKEIRCTKCHKLLFKAESFMTVEVKCSRCKTIHNFKMQDGVLTAH